MVHHQRTCSHKTLHVRPPACPCGPAVETGCNTSRCPGGSHDTRIRCSLIRDAEYSGPHPPTCAPLLVLPGALGDTLQRLAKERTASLQPPHQYVPWVVVNGIPLGDDYENVQTYICAAYTDVRTR